MRLRDSLTKASWTSYSTQKMTLPFPLSIPALNVGVSLAGLICIWSSRWFHWPIHDRSYQSCLIRLSYFVLLLPFALAVLSATYLIPSDLRDCRTEMQWERLFRSKNEAAIRSIQNQLHCCGFNSMRDRAWPFPSRNVDARTCERTSGFLANCGPRWGRGVLNVATLSGIASISNVIFLVSECEDRFLENANSFGSS